MQELTDKLMDVLQTVDELIEDLEAARSQPVESSPALDPNQIPLPF